MQLTKKKEKPRITIVLVKDKKIGNLSTLLNKINNLKKFFDIQIIIVNLYAEFEEIAENSLVENKKIKLISKVGILELSNLIKKLIIQSSTELIAVMEANGQHNPNSLINAYDELIKNNLDLVVGSRFNCSSKIIGLSKIRKKSSEFINRLAKYSLSNKYSHITDCMTGFFLLRQTVECKRLIHKIEVNGLKFLYEFLAISRGKLSIGEIPLTLNANLRGKYKIELAIIWDFLISILHNLSFRLFPRPVISFGLIGVSGIIVQLSTTYFLMRIKNYDFDQVIVFSILVAATSNFLMNNILTFGSNRLRGYSLLIGLIRFIIISSLTLIANVAISTTFYNYILGNAFWAQISGITIGLISNYAGSARFVWKRN